MAKLNGDQIVALMAKGEVKRIQELKTISQNGENIGPDEGYDAFYKVTVNVPKYIMAESEDNLPDPSGYEEGTILIITSNASEE